jgi:hypothetical protein
MSATIEVKQKVKREKNDEVVEGLYRSLNKKHSIHSEKYNEKLEIVKKMDLSQYITRKFEEYHQERIQKEVFADLESTLSPNRHLL